MVDEHAPAADPEATFTIRVAETVAGIDAATFDRLARTQEDGVPVSSPFATHAFLGALEEAGCVGRQTGWLPQHLVLEGPDGAVLAVAPAYLKGHSQGEYVFDHGWADAFERAGGRYYPKLQLSTPFTPATGPRLLVGNGGDSDVRRAALIQGIEGYVAQTGISSAHATFLTRTDLAAFEGANFLHRTDQQFHFFNRGYESFDDFLGTLASRKRKGLRKERAQALSAGIEVEWLSGRDLTEEAWDAFFEFYMDTGSRKWGRPYLNRRFFSLLGERMADSILLVMARRKDRFIAGALNFIGPDRLFGRYWGCVEDHPFLHFEICYHQTVDYAIAHKLSVVEAGAQGEHKLARGYEPVLTHSAHHIAHPGLARAVEDYLERERLQVEATREILHEHAPFRKTDTPRETE